MNSWKLISRGLLKVEETLVVQLQVRGAAVQGYEFSDRKMKGYSQKKDLPRLTLALDTLKCDIPVWFKGLAIKSESLLGNFCSLNFLPHNIISFHILLPCTSSSLFRMGLQCFPSNKFDVKNSDTVKAK